MKEDYIITFIFAILIASLVIGSVYKSDSTITGAISATGEGNNGSMAVIAIISILVGSAIGVGVYQFFLKKRMHKSSNAVKTSPSFSFGNPSNLNAGPSLNLAGAQPKSDVDKLRAYVNTQRMENASDEEIRTKLRSVGWDPKKVEDALKI